jgi:hypothetical protein
MKVARPWKDMPVADVSEFRAKWVQWWSCLQPSSQLAGVNWEPLRKPGKNGFLLVMMSLVWWGKATHADEEWKKSVADVTRVLRCMRLAEESEPSGTKASGKSRKRKSSSVGKENQGSGIEDDHSMRKKT